MIIAWILAGAVIGATLGFIGAGGSVLTVPALVYLADLDPQEATTTSLLVVGATALTGAMPHWRRGNVDWRMAVTIAIAALPGSALGTYLNRQVEGAALLALFGLAMLAAARNMWHPVQETGRTQVEPRGRDLALRVVPVGLTVGVLTGFFGIGGGFVIVPLLVLAVRMPMQHAIGTSLVVIAASSTISLGFHLSSGSVDLAVAATFLAAAAIAAVVAGHLSIHASERRLRRSFAMVLVPLAAVVIVDALRQLG